MVIKMVEGSTLEHSKVTDNVEKLTSVVGATYIYTAR